MSTTLQQVQFRGTRRVRLFFTGNLASGAFTSTSLYTVTSEDNLGANPTNVVEVFSVFNTPNAVELAVDADLAPGGLYEIGCNAVPCADLTNYTGTLDSRVGLALTTPTNVEPETNDVDLLLYGRDLLHDGNDYVEDATGDLGTIAGRENWRGAMGRRMSGSPLPWDPSYSPDAEQYVDAPETYQVPLAGRLLAQARADDRTKQASVEVVQDPNDTGGFAFEMEIVGQDGLDPLTINVPMPST